MVSGMASKMKPFFENSLTQTLKLGSKQDSGLHGHISKKLIKTSLGNFDIESDGSFPFVNSAVHEYQ